jgi:nicotinamidase-related amidase
MPAALLLIDMQTGFHDPVWGMRNNPQSEIAGEALLAAWRHRNWLVFHAQHLSREANSVLRADRPGHAFIPAFQPLPAEPVFQKQVNSAFIGTGLEAALRAASITDIVIFGYTTPHCVSTTTRMAANLGFRVTLAADATASFSANAQTDFPGSRFSAPADPETIHQYALAHLQGEFATVSASEQIISERFSA